MPHYINTLLYEIYFPVASESRQEWGSSILNCWPTPTVATGASVMAGKLKAGNSCDRARIHFLIKWRRADMCTNIVRDVVMTTANLPPMQWRQQNLTLSFSQDSSTSGAMQWIRRPVIFNSGGLALDPVFPPLFVSSCLPLQTSKFPLHQVLSMLCLSFPDC